MMGTKGSRWPEKEAERMSVGLSGDASSGKDPHPKSSLTPQEAPPAGDQEFKHMSPWGLFLIQATT